MTTNVKLTKVLEYLIKNDEDKARELLHDVFIEKARAIHEELMASDEDMTEAEHEHDMHEEEEEGVDEAFVFEKDHDDEQMEDAHMVGGTGDLGKDLTNEIEHMDDEIDFEETMSEADGEEEELDVSDKADMDGDSGAESLEDEMEAVDDKFGELQAALDALKAAFDEINGSDSDEEEEADAEIDMEPAKESMDLDEDFDDLAESLDLEIVEKDPMKAMKTAKDVGAASGGMTVGNDAKSPVPKSQEKRMGAGPVETGKGSVESGFKLETAPKSGDMGLGDNRRKKAADGSSKVTAPSNVDKASNKTSPLTKGGSNLK